MSCCLLLHITSLVPCSYHRRNSRIIQPLGLHTTSKFLWQNGENQSSPFRTKLSYKSRRRKNKSPKHKRCHPESLGYRDQMLRDGTQARSYSSFSVNKFISENFPVSQIMLPSARHVSLRRGRISIQDAILHFRICKKKRWRHTGRGLPSKLRICDMVLVDPDI